MSDIDFYVCGGSRHGERVVCSGEKLRCMEKISVSELSLMADGSIEPGMIVSEEDVETYRLTSFYANDERIRIWVPDHVSNPMEWVLSYAIRGDTK